METMKKIILYLVLLLILSCDGKEIYFEQPQPANSEMENIFPKALQGKYIVDSTSINDSIKFHLIINELTYDYGADDGSSGEKGQLSDSLILKKHKSHYILNYKEEEGWHAIVISTQNIDKFSAHLIGGAMDAYEVEEIEKLKKTTNVKEVLYSSGNGNVDYYLINPTPKEFKKMVKKKIMFSQAATFTRVNK